MMSNKLFDMDNVFLHQQVGGGEVAVDAGQRREGRGEGGY